MENHKCEYCCGWGLVVSVVSGAHLKLCPMCSDFVQHSDAASTGLVSEPATYKQPFPKATD